MNEQGIIVGCDKNQEWLLSWWWEHYSAHNSFPVAFADFGMSEKALSWCKERGTCLTLPEIKVVCENEGLSSDRQRWEKRYGQGVWFFRSAWFKKPFALLHSPFAAGIWLDLDCQVNGALDPLFHSLLLGAEIGLVKEPGHVQDYDHINGYLLPDEINYNSGVIVFRQNADILHQWLEEAHSNNGTHAGDQQALSRVIHQHKPLLIELPAIWNWMRMLGQKTNPDALIDHFIGGKGKLEILSELHPSLIPSIKAAMETL